MGSIRGHLNIHHLNPKLAIKIFESIISPILLYTSPTEKAHLRFCKIYLGLGKKASNLATRGELGKLPLIISIFKRLFNYITHLNSLPESTIAKQAFLLSKDLYQQNKTSFYGNTTNILKSYIDQSLITDLESITPQSLDLITQNIQQSSNTRTLAETMLLLFFQNKLPTRELSHNGQKHRPEKNTNSFPCK